MNQKSSVVQILKSVPPVLTSDSLSSCLEKKRLRDEQKDLLRRFATSEVARDLQESGFAIGGRRVYASVLFCDIRGFTALSENQTPEDTIELLNTYYTLMFEAIGSNKGIVTLMIGDGLMAVFGVPRPIQNPAQGAVNAARDMFAMMSDLNAERVALGAPEIRLGVGIATGDVVAGYTGTDQRATYTCIGSTVNLAARLEAHTKIAGCDILIDDETRACLDDADRVRQIGAVEFKGFSQAVNIYSVPVPLP